MTVELWGCIFLFFVTVMLVHVSSKNVPIETFNISFENTQNKQHYDTKVTGTEVRKK